MPELPPSPPWTPGRKADHTVIRLMVDLLRMDDGRVFSDLSLEPEQLQLMAQWPNGGLAESGYALLVEAVRREAIFGILLQQSQDPTFMAKMNGLSPEKREIELKELASKVASQVSDLTDRIAFDVVRDVYSVIK